MADFDEVLFSLPNVLDFQLILTGGGQEHQLRLDVQLKGSVTLDTESLVLKELDKIPVVRVARKNGSLKVFPHFVASAEVISQKGTAKRQIQDKRGSA